MTTSEDEVPEPWIKLKDCPSNYPAIPMIRSNNEIIIAPETHENINALLRYVVEKDEYVNWI